MTTGQVVSALGRAARDAARGDGPASEFSRGQLMSAYSASRHLAVELAEFPAELREFAGDVAAELRQAGGLRRGGELVTLGGELAKQVDHARIGGLLGEALDCLRDDPAPAAAALRTRLHGALRRLSDREVDLLAAAIEGPRKT